MADSSKSERDRKCEMGYLEGADGSCLYSLGETVVMAAVNGPGDVRSSKQMGDRSLVDVYFHRKVGGSMATGSNNTAADRIVERHLRNVCESCILTKQFPRSIIVITVQELHNDGSLIAAAINSTCLALLDAGLPMRTVFAAITVILVDGEEETLVVEPNLKQESGNVRARMVFIFESDGEVVGGNGDVDMEKGASMGSCTVEGAISRQQLKAGREMARNCALGVFGLYRTIVEKRFSRRMEFVDRKGVALIEK